MMPLAAATKKQPGRVGCACTQLPLARREALFVSVVVVLCCCGVVPMQQVDNTSVRECAAHMPSATLCARSTPPSHEKAHLKPLMWRSCSCMVAPRDLALSAAML